MSFSDALGSQDSDRVSGFNLGVVVLGRQSLFYFIDAIWIDLDALQFSLEFGHDFLVDQVSYFGIKGFNNFDIANNVVNFSWSEKTFHFDGLNLLYNVK